MTESAHDQPPITPEAILSILQEPNRRKGFYEETLSNLKKHDEWFLTIQTWLGQAQAEATPAEFGNFMEGAITAYHLEDGAGYPTDGEALNDYFTAIIAIPDPTLPQLLEEATKWDPNAVKIGPQDVVGAPAVLAHLHRRLMQSGEDDPYKIMARCSDLPHRFRLGCASASFMLGHVKKSYLERQSPPPVSTVLRLVPHLPNTAES